MSCYSVNILYVRRICLLCKHELHNCCVYAMQCFMIFFVEQPTNMSSFSTLHCKCSHLSIFSGGIIVDAAPIDVFNVALFQDFFNNPAIVSVVIFIWLIYFVLIYWAKHEDYLDVFRVYLDFQLSCITKCVLHIYCMCFSSNALY